MLDKTEKTLVVIISLFFTVAFVVSGIVVVGSFVIFVMTINTTMLVRIFMLVCLAIFLGVLNLVIHAPTK